jgi:hypothetical protein
LPKLKYLNIMNNNFSGSIPPQFFDTGFEFLYAGNPCLNSSVCQSSAPPPSLPPSNVPSESKSSTSIGPIVGGAVGGVLVVVAILLLLFFIFRRHRQQHRPMLVPQNSKLAGMQFVHSFSLHKMYNETIMCIITALGFMECFLMVLKNVLLQCPSRIKV